MKIHCEKKDKDYTLIQADSSQISFAEEKSKGYIYYIDDWVKDLNKVVEYLKVKKEHFKDEDIEKHLHDGDEKSSDESN
jgi:hypothetical protein